jgi:hypothetical protein
MAGRDLAGLLLSVGLTVTSACMIYQNPKDHHLYILGSGALGGICVYGRNLARQSRTLNEIGDKT